MADVNISKYRASVVREGSKPATPGFVVSEGQDPVNPPGTNNFVPYSGATSNVELGEFGLETGFINLDTTPTGTPTTQGTIFWDADDETVDIILNGYTMKIGEDLFYPVKNQTGSTIAKGVAVRFAGTLGASGRLLIEPFIANGTVPSSLFMGVTAEEILNGDDGKVLYFGRVRGINTDAFNEGDILYASTTVAGGYQTAIPLPPNNIVQVAAVISKSPTVGTIFVRPTLGSNINTDEGVKITSVADKNLLQYQSGTALWENKTLAQVLGGTSSQFVKGDGSLDSTSYQPLLTNPVTGTGTTNYLPKFTGSTTIGDSALLDNNVTVSVTNRDFRIVANEPEIYLTKTGTDAGSWRILGSTGGTTRRFRIYDENASADRLNITTGGSVLINSTSDNGARFQVTGDATFSSSVTANGISSIGQEQAFTWQRTTGTASDVYSLNADSGSAYLYNNTTANILMLWLEDGNVGIGTSSPQRRLHVLNDAANNDLQLRLEGNAGNYFDLGRFRDTGAFHIQGNQVGDNNICLAPTSGNVLIGTTSDNGARLQVSGSARIDGASASLNFTGGNNRILFNSYRALEGSTDGATLQLGEGYSKTLLQGGNVGIGTSSPSFRLNIADASGATRMVVDNTANAGAGAGVYMRTYNGATLVSNATIRTDNAGNFQIFTGTSTDAERLRITSVGKLLVGQINPSGNFDHVFSNPTNSGTLVITQTSSISNPSVGLFSTLDSGDNLWARFFYGSSGFIAGSIDYNRGAGLVRYNTTSDANLKNLIGDSNKQKSIDILNSTKIREYSWKHDDSNNRQIGVIAQELYETFKGAVSVGSEEQLLGTENYKPWGVDKTAFTFHLIAGWQEHERIIKELKQEIETLKN